MRIVWSYSYGMLRYATNCMLGCDLYINSDRLLCVSYLNIELNFATFELKAFVFWQKHVSIRSEIGFRYRNLGPQISIVPVVRQY